MAIAGIGAIAKAVSAAGGFGFTQAGYDSPTALANDLASIRTEMQAPEGTALPIGVGFIGWVLDKDGGDSVGASVGNSECVRVALEGHPRAVWFAFGDALGRYIAQVRASDKENGRKTVVFVIVNSVEEARVAMDEWHVDVLVAQGMSTYMF
jgi:nitronate monooxygenase